MTIEGTIKIDMEVPLSIFGLGKTVFVVLGPGHYCQGQITAYRSWVLESDGKIIVLPNAVRLSTYTLTNYFDDIDDDAVPFRYLTDNEGKASGWSRVIPVECSDEDWFKAIGERPTFEEIKKGAEEKTFDSEESIEECELASCCAGISNVRTILIKCQKNKGLIGWEVESLQEAVNNSGHDMAEDAPILTNILKQLNVEWRTEE